MASSKQNPNLDILLLATEQLGALLDEVVFLGGCATGLLLTDAAAPSVRVTKDVDVIVEVTSRSNYYQFEKKLRQQGFQSDTSSDVLCRWRGDGVILDVMPTDEKILGFANDWYTPAIRAAKKITLLGGMEINMVTASYFLATKLEAFHGRGKGDYLLSHDIEDFVAVMDGRPEIEDEIKSAEYELRAYLKEEFTALLNTTAFVQALSGHLPPDFVSEQRVATVKEKMKLISML
ncbi:MAG: hypothetical protein ISR69_15055 [Gammaproteobacteria bacterium]|nr:hypothetical protein [Gammaproteobacteria bacterium]